MPRSTNLLLALALQANLSSEKLAKLLLLLPLLRKMMRSIFLEKMRKKMLRLRNSRLNVSQPTTRKRPISPRLSRRSVDFFKIFISLKVRHRDYLICIAFFIVGRDHGCQTLG
jgi:hypothetical protein